jgi:hypothetical protein
MRPQVTNYTLLCLVSLTILLMGLAERGLWPWALLPGVVGALAVVLRWPLGSVLFISSLCGILLVGSFRSIVPVVPSFHPSDVILCGAALAFVIGHSRLLSLTRSILPSDPRLIEWIRMHVVQATETDLRREAPRERVAAGAASGWEVVRLLLGLPVWLIAGQVGWLWLRSRNTDLPIHAELWRLLLVFFGCVLVLITLNVVFTIWRYLTLTKAEAHMIVQDAQWSEMRNEQRLMSRWLAWARGCSARKEPL